LRALVRPGRDVVVDTVDLGSFAELRERITTFRPHIVHLSGRRVAGTEQAFAFENESGPVSTARWRPPQESVDRTLTAARWAVRERCDQRGDPSWSLPVLYAGSRQARVFDPSRRQASLRPSLNLRPLPEAVDIRIGARCWGISTFELTRRCEMGKRPADGFRGQRGPR
jgi:hypothetical protein